MYTPMKFKVKNFSKCNNSSFISFIFSLFTFNNELWISVVGDAVFS